MNRIEVELFGKKCSLKAPGDSGGIVEAVKEVQRRGEEISRRAPKPISREDIFMLISLNLAQELQEQKSKNANLFSQDTVDESR